ncbi:MAG: Holliday junction resolvase RuvX [Candidatus Niyogibacteria bacterium]|nr:Holliday junction resolvase RuvX [Candidatus Niyogibacteria bacterium]
MRFLGIDYGKKRIGTAMSDKEGQMAFPYAIIENNAEKFRAIGKICENEGISKIIMGLPKNLKGKETEMTKEIQEFGRRLYEEIGLKVIFQDEILSTKEAIRLQGRHKKIDASAAALILDSYLKK